MTLYRDGVLEYRADAGRAVKGTINIKDVKEVVRSKECVCRQDWPHNTPKWPKTCLENSMFALVTDRRTYFLYTFTTRETFTWVAQIERLMFDLALQAAEAKPPPVISPDV